MIGRYQPIKKGTGIIVSCAFLVEVTGLEPAASCSQSKRATNCATPRYLVVTFCFLLPLSFCFVRPACGAPKFFVRFWLAKF